jgi:hypothetical protein
MRQRAIAQAAPRDPATMMDFFRKPAVSTMMR